MINLVVAGDIINDRVKTIHLDEYTGELITELVDITDRTSLENLASYNAEKCTLTNYDVVTNGDSAQLMYANIPDKPLEDVLGRTSYSYELSQVGFLRHLVNIGAKVLTTDKNPTALELYTLKSHNSSFALTMPYLFAKGNETFSWRTHTLLENDPHNNFAGMASQTFLLPDCDLGEYESCVERTGTHLVYDHLGQALEYDKIVLRESLPEVEERPVDFTIVEALSALQLLIDAYDLALPVLTSAIFAEKTIVKEPYMPPKGRGGYVNIAGQRKVSAPLREKYMLEVRSMVAGATSNSVLLNNDPLFSTFLSFYTPILEWRGQATKLFALYRKYKTSYALLHLLLLEAKINLFEYDPVYLTMLSKVPYHDTGIEGYFITVKAGGTTWRPVI